MSERLNEITDNLHTRPEWKLHDYQDFYERDVVVVLLPEVKRLKVAAAKASAELRHMYKVGTLSQHDKGLVSRAIQILEGA